MRYTKLILPLILIFGVKITQAQNLVEVIENSEKAVFESLCYDKDGKVIDRANGFFISPNGLAITMSSIFEKADSAAIKTYAGKNFRIDRIISIHPYTNLALIKVKPSRQKPFSYLLPSKTSYRQDEELLTFCIPEGNQERAKLGRIYKLQYFPFVSRTGIIEDHKGVYSSGSPAINYRGEFSGIINGLPQYTDKVVYNSYLLHDKNWIDVNLTIRNLGDRPEVSMLLSPEISNGIFHILGENYVEAARLLSNHIKVYDRDIEAICLRAYARYNYNNKAGSRDDFKKCIEIDPSFPLTYYFRGLFELEENEKDKARVDFALCLDKDSTYAPAISELAALDFEKYENIQDAYNRFSTAIFYDSLQSKAYYERSRLRFKYSDNTKGTLEDINKTIYLNPNVPGIYTLRGIMRSNAQDEHGAISDFNKAIQKDPNDVHAYFNRAISKYNLGLIKEACSDWNKAGELGNYDAYKYISRYCKNVK